MQALHEKLSLSSKQAQLATTGEVTDLWPGPSLRLRTPCLGLV